MNTNFIEQMNKKRQEFETKLSENTQQDLKQGVKNQSRIYLIPGFKKADAKRFKEENDVENNQELIKELRKKLEDGTITDEESQKLYNLLI
jgi:hypothetical protein